MTYFRSANRTAEILRGLNPTKFSVGDMAICEVAAIVITKGSVPGIHLESVADQMARLAARPDLSPWTRSLFEDAYDLILEQMMILQATILMKRFAA